MEGEAGFTDQARKRKDQQYIRQLEDEVSLLKQLLAERDIEIALRDELLKKVSLGEKKQIARQYMAQRVKRDKVLAVCRLSKNQFYYTPTTRKSTG